MHCCCRCLQANVELLRVQQQLTEAHNHMSMGKEALAATQVITCRSTPASSYRVSPGGIAAGKFPAYENLVVLMCEPCLSQLELAAADVEVAAAQQQAVAAQARAGEMAREVAQATEAKLACASRATSTIQRLSSEVRICKPLGQSSSGQPCPCAPCKDLEAGSGCCTIAMMTAHSC